MANTFYFFVLLTCTLFLTAVVMSTEDDNEPEKRGDEYDFLYDFWPGGKRSFLADAARKAGKRTSFRSPVGKRYVFRNAALMNQQNKKSMFASAARNTGKRWGNFLSFSSAVFKVLYWPQFADSWIRIIFKMGQNLPTSRWFAIPKPYRLIWSRAFHYRWDVFCCICRWFLYWVFRSTFRTPKTVLYFLALVKMRQHKSRKLSLWFFLFFLKIFNRLPKVHASIEAGNRRCYLSFVSIFTIFEFYKGAFWQCQWRKSFFRHKSYFSALWDFSNFR